MSDTRNASLRRLPSVDEVLRTGLAEAAIGRFGRKSVVASIRACDFGSAPKRTAPEQ